MTFYSTVELLAQGLLCSLVGTPHLFISLLEKCHEVILVNLQLKAVVRHQLPQVRHQLPAGDTQLPLQKHWPSCIDE